MRRCVHGQGAAPVDAVPVAGAPAGSGARRAGRTVTGGVEPAGVARRFPPAPGARGFVAAIVAAQVLTQIGAFTLPALLPGVMGAPDGLAEESFADGLLEYPHYTRPADWQGRAVPEVLLSGHHEKIRAWRRERAEAVTRARRPDLWARYVAGRDNSEKKEAKR